MKNERFEPLTLRPTVRSATTAPRRPEPADQESAARKQTILASRHPGWESEQTFRNDRKKLRLAGLCVPPCLEQVARPTTSGVRECCVAPTFQGGSKVPDTRST